MGRVTVNLHLDKEEYKKYYQGLATTVVCHATDGRVIKFPANILRPYLTHDGITGSFLIEFDERGKLQKIEKIQ